MHKVQARRDVPTSALAKVFHFSWPGFMVDSDCVARGISHSLYVPPQRLGLTLSLSSRASDSSAAIAKS